MGGSVPEGRAAHHVAVGFWRRTPTQPLLRTVGPAHESIPPRILTRACRDEEQKPGGLFLAEAARSSEKISPLIRSSELLDGDRLMHRTRLKVLSSFFDFTSDFIAAERF